MPPLWTSVHSSSGILSTGSNPLNLFITSTARDLTLVMLEWPSGFPYFLQFKSEFGIQEFMIWATVSSQSCFCWLYRAFPSLAAKNIINLISALTIWWYPCVDSSVVSLDEGVCYDQCILLFSSISLHWWLRKAFLSLLAIFAFKWVYLSFSPLLFTSLLFTAVYKASSDNHFAFLHFFFLGMVSILSPV